MSDREIPRALDRDEDEMISQSRALEPVSSSDLADLLRRLRNRRDRAQRLIRTRARKAEGGKTSAGPDTGAREKKALLTEAIGRVRAEIDHRDGTRKAADARRNLEAAVMKKAETQPWRGPENQTANTGPAETPNRKIAPSGALHAEGMRAAVARATGDR